MLFRRAGWLLQTGKAVELLPEVANETARVPWHRSNHKMFKNLPITVRTWPGITPGTRFRVELVKTALWKYRPVKELTAWYPASGGRNFTGRITVRHRGGGIKMPTLTVNYKYSIPEVPKKLIGWQDGGRRSAWLSLVYYRNGIFAYHPTIDGIEKGATIGIHPTGSSAVPQRGEWWKVGDIPAGQMVCNLELHPGRGGTVARAAGTYCTVLANQPETRAEGLTPVLLPSKEVRLVKRDCWCTVGRIGCVDHKFERFGKAGDRRRLGWRPSVKGNSMNPVDHPHGGNANGKKAGKRGGRHPGPWSVYGKLRAKFMKTRSKKKTSWQFIARRRQDSKKLSQVEMLHWTRLAYTPKQRTAQKALFEKRKEARPKAESGNASPQESRQAATSN